MSVDFGHGYDIIRAKAKQCNMYLMSCFNCDHFYQAVGDDEELCQNPDVLEYDIINTDSSIYCLQWKPVLGRSDEKRVGFKNGVSLGGHKKEVEKARGKSRKRVKRTTHPSKRSTLGSKRGRKE